MSRLAHLSDLHVDGTAERRRRLDRALGRAWNACDLLVITGDLTAWGDRKDLDELSAALADWPPDRAVLVPGNHDLGEAGSWNRVLAETPLGRFAATSAPGAVTDLGDCAVVAVSTQYPRRALAFRALGRIGPEQVRRVEDVCAAAGARTVVAAMHHGPHWHLLQPFDGLTDRQEVHRMLRAWPRLHVLCGHDHRELDLGDRVRAAPSLADGEGDPLRFYDAAGGLLVPVP